MNNPLELFPFIQETEIDQLLTKKPKRSFSKKSDKNRPAINLNEKIKLSCIVKLMFSKIRCYYRSFTFQELIKSNISDALLWSRGTVDRWFKHVPVVSHLQKYFANNELIGSQLLKLSNKSLLVDYHIVNEADRRLLLGYISLLKSSENISSFHQHQELVNDIIKQIESEPTKICKEPLENSKYNPSSLKLGSSKWVEANLKEYDLTRIIKKFESMRFPLFLVPYLDESQIHAIFSGNTELLPMEKVELICLIRKMNMDITMPFEVYSDGQYTRVEEWTVQDVSFWLSLIPTLKQLCKLFERHGIDGKKLLKLNEKKLLMKLKLGCESERNELLYYIAEFQAIRVTTYIHKNRVTIENIVTKLGKQLSVTIPKIITQGQGKRIPNYFVSLRIKNTSLTKKVKQIQDEIMEELKDLGKIIVPVSLELLHFTLGRLYLQSQEDIDKCKEYIETCKSIYDSIYSGKEMSISFNNITNYGGNTIFLETKKRKETDMLIEFGNSVYSLLRSSGLTSREFRFQPVVAIIRIKKKKLSEELQQRISKCLERFCNIDLGKEIFEELEISSTTEYEESGYYKALAKVNWM